MKRLEEINKVVAEFYGLDPKSRGYLITRKKYGNKTLPRQVAQFIARDSYKYGFAKIGRYYNVDHGAIMSNVSTVKGIMSYSTEFRIDILTIKLKLNIFNLKEMIEVRDDLTDKINKVIKDFIDGCE